MVDQNIHFFRYALSCDVVVIYAADFDYLYWRFIKEHSRHYRTTSPSNLSKVCSDFHFRHYCYAATENFWPFSAPSDLNSGSSGLLQ